MKKITALLLAGLLLLTGMAGCKPEPQEPPYEVFNDNAYTIASDGVTRFSIVYCEKESEADWDLKEAVEKLRTIIADKTGAQIPAEVRQALLNATDILNSTIQWRLRSRESILLEKW